MRRYLIELACSTPNSASGVSLSTLLGNASSFAMAKPVVPIFGAIWRIVRSVVNEEAST